MKTFYTFIFKRAVLLFILLLIVSVNLHSQPQYYNYNTIGSTNSFPFNIAMGKQLQLLYLAGDFNQPTPAPAGNITSVFFKMAANLGPYTYSNLVIKLGQSTITVLPTGGWYTGQLDTVYSRASVSLSGIAGDWVTITLDRPFLYDPSQSLIIDIQQCGAPGATGFSSTYTILTGFRRNTSLVNTSCPFAWGNQNNYAHHVGVNIGPATCIYSWANQTSGTTLQLYSVKAVSDQIVWACGNTGVVRKTINGGTTWTDGNPNPGVINGIVYAIDALDANTAWCTTSPANTFIYKTTNGGANWTQVFTQTGGFINSIAFSDANNGFAEGDPVGGRWSLWKTTDGGNNWDSTGLYLIQAGTEAGWNNSLFVMGNNIWFGTNNTKVYKSINSGSNYTSGATTGLVSSFSIHFNNANLGLAGGTTIVKTTDGGVTYTSVGTVPGAGTILGIEGKDSDFWYTRGTGIYRSSNSGDNWTQVYTATGSLTDIDFPVISGCLVGWAVGAAGAIAKMTGTAVGAGSNVTEIPDKFILEQNYPNPFNPTTIINYQLPEFNHVSLKIYDILGKEVTTLVNESQSAGRYSIEFDGANYPSGTYYYKLETDNYKEVKKMILTK